MCVAISVNWLKTARKAQLLAKSSPVFQISLSARPKNPAPDDEVLSLSGRSEDE